MIFNKWFKLPGPKALGMSDNDYAMASEFFRNNQEEHTWEQYYERVAQMYPVRFFLASTLPMFFQNLWRNLTRPFKNIYWWFRHHTTNCYHWVDIRQPKGRLDDYGYQYGWLDTDTRIEFAIINLFIEFMEEELPHSFFVPSEEEASKDDGVDYQYAGFKRQRDDYLEMTAIYHWLTKERYVEQKEYDDKLIQWSDARHAWDPNGEVL